MQYYINQYKESEVQYMIVFFRNEEIKDDDKTSKSSVIEKFFAVYYKSICEWKIHPIHHITDFMIMCSKNSGYEVSFLDELASANDDIIMVDGVYLPETRERSVEYFKSICIDDEQKLVMGKDSDKPDSSFPWYYFDSCIEGVRGIAKKILRDYPDSQKIALGQSFAWIVKTMKILDSDQTCGYIPFSGNFLKELNPDDEIVEFVKDMAKYPTESQIQSYRKVLDSYCNPREILRSYKEDSKPTILLEYTVTNKGLASFLSLLYDYAQDIFEEDDYLLFAEALQVLVLRDYKDHYDEDDKFIEKENYKIKYNKKEFDISIMYLQNLLFKDDQIVSLSPNFEFIEPGLRLLLHISLGEDSGPECDRLVPKYTKELWGGSIPDMLSTEHTDMIEAKISGLCYDVSGE